ncbi:MAG: hypothetical protein WCI02_18800, partial [Planctomycetota bacterium]
AETLVEGAIRSAAVTAVQGGEIPSGAETAVEIEETTAETSHHKSGGITNFQSMLHRNTSQVG